MTTTTAPAAIYARYSSYLQREASIEDQVEVCRGLLAVKGWTPVATHDDVAARGASRFPQNVTRLTADAAVGKLDRLSHARSALQLALAAATGE